MADETKKYDLFGPTPDEIKSQALANAQANDISLAKLSPQEMTRKTAISSGRVFGDALNKLAGVEDPNVSKAQKMQLLRSQVELDAQDKGIDLNTDPEGYFQLLTDRALAMGMTDVPLSALPMINELRRIRANEMKAAADRAAAGADNTKVKDVTKVNMMEGQAFLSNAFRQSGKELSISKEGKVEDFDNFDLMNDQMQREIRAMHRATGQKGNINDLYAQVAPKYVNRVVEVDKYDTWPFSYIGSKKVYINDPTEAEKLLNDEQIDYATFQQVINTFKPQ